MSRAYGILMSGLVALGITVAAGQTPAFPGAVGFGTETPGGRGGKILRVTTLDPAGTGSLREALETPGPRIVVFEVGGIIDLQTKGLGIREPFVTVAGETAPSPGITVIRGGLNIGTHDVVVRHIRVRPGDAGKPKRSGWEPDGICIAGKDAYDVVVDHCSTTWAVDENLSVSGPRTEGPDATARRVTISNCIIAEGLDDSSHKKGKHSKGSLIHDFCRDIAIIGNLYAHNVQRNPYLKAHTTGVVVNNLVYNPGSNAIQVNYVEREWNGVDIEPKNCRIAAVGNVLIHGKDTRLGLDFIERRGDVYEADNLAFDRRGKPADVMEGGVTRLAEKPVWPVGLEPIPAAGVMESVLRHAGARPGDRDSVDRRILREVSERGGRIIDSQEDVGGYPRTEPTRRTLDVPERDVDAWLARFAAEVE